MTTSATFAPTVESRAFDPTKHVNFTLGMLLGVDDFNQEFSYLSGRDKWQARETVGYGTLCGLRVAVEDDPAKGARVSVTSGSALTPTGQLVCVCPGQCAQIEEWLMATSDDVTKHVASGSVKLHVVLCYRDCPTDPVPFPGEPCRDESKLTVASRLTDSFRLDLRLDPPNQNEETAIRGFAQWLRKLSIGGLPPYAAIGDLERALRDSAPKSGEEVKFADAPASLRVDPAQVETVLRRLFAVWTTDVRPLVHALYSGTGGCCSNHGKTNIPLDECLLLSTLSVPVVLDSGKWRVNGLAAAVKVDDSARPYLLHARMLQEIVAGRAAESAGAGYRIVAAGLLGSTPEKPTLGGLRLKDTGGATLVFDGYDPAGNYVLKVMAGASPPNNLVIGFVSQSERGLTISAMRGGKAISTNALQKTPLMVEISRIG